MRLEPYVGPAAPAKTVTALLKRVRKRLSDPRRWIKGHVAVAGNGRDVHARHPGARRWDLLGALWAGPATPIPLVLYARDVIESAINDPPVSGWNGTTIGIGISSWNDSTLRTHGDVLAALDKAIITSKGG